MRRVHLTLPPELLAEIDSNFGPRKRTWFFRKTLRGYFDRQRLEAQQAAKLNPKKSPRRPAAC